MVQKVPVKDQVPFKDHFRNSEPLQPSKAPAFEEDAFQETLIINTFEEDSFQETLIINTLDEDVHLKKTGVSICPFAVFWEKTKKILFFHDHQLKIRLLQYHQLKIQYFPTLLQVISQKCTLLLNHQSLVTNASFSIHCLPSQTQKEKKKCNFYLK